jgi:hypothetical protein
MPVSFPTTQIPVPTSAGKTTGSTLSKREEYSKSVVVARLQAATNEILDPAAKAALKFEKKLRAKRSQDALSRSDSVEGVGNSVTSQSIELAPDLGTSTLSFQAQEASGPKNISFQAVRTAATSQLIQPASVIETTTPMSGGAVQVRQSVEAKPKPLAVKITEPSSKPSIQSQVAVHKFNKN